MNKTATMKQMVLVIALGLFALISGCEKEPGPQGPKGEQGDQGATGQDGKDGLDGIDGEDGANGKDSPNKSFYFQHGFKSYAGAIDTYISSYDPTTNYSDNVLAVQFNTLDFSSGQKNALIRFDNIAETILPYLDDPVTEGSAADYYINEAVLYLYCYNASSSFEGDLWLKVTFYDDDDPFFAESIATWNFANEVQAWAGGVGGISNGNWASAYPSYVVSLPNLDLYGGGLGWIGIPLPRQVIKSWISDAENSNKGIRIQLFCDPGKEADAILGFYSKEHEVEDLRPLLFVNGEPANVSTGGRKAEGYWEQNLVKWESSSWEEKMAPLYQYLSSK